MILIYVYLTIYIAFITASHELQLIHPHYKRMFPGGVKEITALDQKLSGAPKWR